MKYEFCIDDSALPSILATKIIQMGAFTDMEKRAYNFFAHILSQIATDGYDSFHIQSANYSDFCKQHCFPDGIRDKRLGIMIDQSECIIKWVDEPIQTKTVESHTLDDMYKKFDNVDMCIGDVPLYIRNYENYVNTHCKQKLNFILDLFLKYAVDAYDSISLDAYNEMERDWLNQLLGGTVVNYLKVNGIRFLIDTGSTKFMRLSNDHNKYKELSIGEFLKAWTEYIHA